TLVLEIPEQSDEQDIAAATTIRISWLHRIGAPAGDPSALAAEAAAIELAPARPGPRLPVRRGEGRVPAAGGPRRAGARPGPDVTQGLLGPRPRQRQPRRARPRRLRLAGCERPRAGLGGGRPARGREEHRRPTAA